MLMCMRPCTSPWQQVRACPHVACHRLTIDEVRFADSFLCGSLPPMCPRSPCTAPARSPCMAVCLSYTSQDPHLDPALDGEHVFILGLDSDTVLTLCPVRLLSVWRAGRAALSALTLADERDTVKAEAEQSWTPWDIDVLARKHTLVGACGHMARRQHRPTQ